MARLPHPHSAHPHPHDQALRDRELDAWLEHAFGLHDPDPEPVVHDLND